MLVAVDGVALTGKSALVAELVEAFPGCESGVWPTLLPVELGSLQRFEDTISWYDPLGETPVVLEGSPLCELVWPEISRRPTDMVDPAIRRHVDMFTCSRGLVLIYATRDYADLHDAWYLAGGEYRAGALPLALQRYEQALTDSHSRGYVFEHDHVQRHLAPQDIAFVAGQADDDVRPLYGVTHRWIGNPNPRWVIATSGYTDQDIPGRANDGLHPTVAHVLRNLPERAWRGVALVDIAEISDEGLREFARLADAEAWVALGDEAKERVLDIVQPRRCWSPGYSVLGDYLGAAWGLWTEL